MRSQFWVKGVDQAHPHFWLETKEQAGSRSEFFTSRVHIITSYSKSSDLDSYYKYPNCNQNGQKGGKESNSNGPALIRCVSMAGFLCLCIVNMCIFLSQGMTFISGLKKRFVLLSKFKTVVQLTIPVDMFLFQDSLMYRNVKRTTFI